MLRRYAHFILALLLVGLGSQVEAQQSTQQPKGELYSQMVLSKPPAGPLTAADRMLVIQNGQMRQMAPLSLLGTATAGGASGQLQFNNGGILAGLGIGSNLSVSSGNLNALGTPPAGSTNNLQKNAGGGAFGAYAGTACPGGQVPNGLDANGNVTGCTLAGGLSGMTAGQVPLAATATTVTSSFSLGTGVQAALGTNVGSAGAFTKNNGDALSGTFTGPVTFTGAHTFTTAANTTPLTITGSSITGASTVVPGINESFTLNTTGKVVGSALYANITWTAAGNDSTLLDLSSVHANCGGTTYFRYVDNGFGRNSGLQGFDACGNGALNFMSQTAWFGTPATVANYALIGPTGFYGFAINIKGTNFGFANPTISGCGYGSFTGGSNFHGGNSAAVLISGVTGTCTFTVIPEDGVADNTWGCIAQDVDHPAIFTQTSYNTTQYTLSGPATSGDRIIWFCMLF